MELENKKILNFGCANTRLPNSIGVDVRPREGFVDVVCDLNKIPYPFPDNFADEIHMYHVLEHLDNPLEKLEEVFRILKPNGIFYLRVPHFSSLYAWGDITHKQAFSLNAFDFLDRSTQFRDLKYSNVSFTFLRRSIRYFYTWPNEKWYMENIVKPVWPPFVSVVLKPLIMAINFLIGLSPTTFERFWCYWIGGAAEIYLVLKSAKKDINENTSLPS